VFIARVRYTGGPRRQEFPMTDTRPHVSIASIAPNSYVDGVYNIVNPQVAVTRTNKPYLKCILRDASGEVNARQWSFDEGTFEDLCSTGFVWVAGRTELYNNQIQFVIDQVKAMQVSDEDLVHLLPSTRKNIDQMFGQIQSIMSTMAYPAMNALAQAYLSDADMMANLRRAPAAVNLHHAWIGGLLEHTLQLLTLAEVMLPHYPHLNRDIVLMGLFLHDLGKTVELTWDKGFNYTTEGNLIGHVVRGVIWLQIKAAIAAKQSGHRLPPDALKVLQHIVISHHGQYEFGAAKLPSTPEAIFVAMLDNLDAKTTMAMSLARPDGVAPAGAEFTDKIWALDTRLYRPDPLAAPTVSAEATVMVAVAASAT
jgi:3'-5' exoribonuclease